MSVSSPLQGLAIATLAGTFGLGAVSLLARPSGAATTFVRTVPPARPVPPLTTAAQRLRVLEELPRHPSAAQIFTSREVQAPAGAPRYIISPIGPVTQNSTLTALAINQTGRALLGDGSNAYVAFVNDSGPILELAHGCPPACDPTGNGLTYFVPTALNNVGSVAGNWFDIFGGSPEKYANEYFVQWILEGRTASAITELYPAISETFIPYFTPSSINDRGVSVGDYGPALPVSPTGAAAFFGGKLTYLASPPGGAQVGTADAIAINNAGTIVGGAYTADVHYRAVRFRLNGPAVLLPVPNSYRSYAAGINTGGDIVGVSFPSGGYYQQVSFLIVRGRTMFLPPPPPPPNSKVLATDANALNDSDEVVGDLQYSTGSAAFLNANGRTYDLNTLIPRNAGWQIVDAEGINDRGEIVGNGYYKGNMAPYVLKLAAPTVVASPAAQTFSCNTVTGAG